MYYHVSSLRKEGDKLLRTDKIGYDYCCYASSCDLSTFEKYIECYNNLLLSNVYAMTHRTAQKWICEYIFEKVRKYHYPDLPSRLWGIFLTNSLEAAKEFLYEKRNYPVYMIFEIVIKDEESVHCFDMDIFTKAHTNLETDPLNPSFYNEAFELAKQYWETNNTYTGTKEYLVEDESLIIGKELFCLTPEGEEK